MKRLGTYDTRVAREVTLDRVLSVFRGLDANKIYVKKLSPNDNSKNQPYFGGHLTDLTFLPTGDVFSSLSQSKKTSDPRRSIKYQAHMDLSWVDAEGGVYRAPNAKLIYYPQYPEVRFSGFLQGSDVRAGKWMDPNKEGRAEGRWLILGVTAERKIYAYLVTPDCSLSNELSGTELTDISGVFSLIDLEHSTPKKSTRQAIIEKARDIHLSGWIPGQRLNSCGNTIPYNAPNGGGYTLEAQLGVTPNGFAEPDFLGWEVKQFGIAKFPRTGAKPTTLMTPEPDGGVYKDRGAIEFVRTWGYPDRSGIKDRLNFGGKHTAGKRTASTGLKLEITGFDIHKGVIIDANGAIGLMDTSDTVAASWSFPKIMDHWKRKHSKAVFIPSLRRKAPSGGYEYHYGCDIELGTGTDFELFLTAMIKGLVFYDPGIKLEKASEIKPKLKKRSQFRVNHKYLEELYINFDFINVLN